MTGEQVLGWHVSRAGVFFRSRSFVISWHRGWQFVRIPPMAKQVAPGVWCFYLLGFEFSWLGCAS